MTDRHGKARIYCYQGRQVKACDRRSAMLDGVEDQLAAYLATFRLPEETVAEVIRLHEQATDQRDDAERRRREIAGRIERIAELYKWGDLTREAYRSERERLEAELAGLRGATDRARVLAQAAGLLRDLPAAWRTATPDQRNALARLVFRSVELVDDRVAAVVPQPDFAPFFAARAAEDGLLADNENGAEEAAPSSEVMNGRKRRESVARDRRRGAAPRPLPLPRAGAPPTATPWGWAVGFGGNGAADPPGALAGGGGAGGAGGAAGGGARPRRLPRDGADGGANGRKPWTHGVTRTGQRELLTCSPVRFTDARFVDTCPRELGHENATEPGRT